LCQSILEGAIEEAGFNRNQLVQDHSPGISISHDSSGVCAYVDNFGVISPCSLRAYEGVLSICAVLRAKGFRTPRVVPLLEGMVLSILLDFAFGLVV
jgi:hypothetical protein